MKIFEADVSRQVIELLKNKLTQITEFKSANDLLAKFSGILNFVSSQEEYDILKQSASATDNIASEPDRTEYGDFQTNLGLAKSVTEFLKAKKVDPEFVIEPTCGRGNFLIAALQVFPNLKKVVGIEIYKPYVWETKFSILDYFITNPTQRKPEIQLHNFNVFDFDFRTISNTVKQEVLILGNPPWVTNAKLGSLESKNLPQKSNFKKHNGFDAITGKGNFDIGECITLMMLDAFQQTPGHLAFLVKNSVVKNLLLDQKSRKYHISNIQKLTIDSKKEFEVSVEASLLFCRVNSDAEFTCKEFDFYNHSDHKKEFGWINDKFVSNTKYYGKSKDIDGVCPFEWRQGLKHDASSVMELERINGHFVNGNDEEVSLEEDLVFGVLKSSDLKHLIINQSRKFTIVTQTRIGEDTTFIKKKFPKTYKYLTDKKPYFDQRKSSIYENKPDFSIFGIGDYSFAPYKICISGLYKTFTFSLVLPHQAKPLMLDDTCYLLAFDDIDFAAYTLIVLNSLEARNFLESITFADAKRTFTKDILMRIDLHKLSLKIPKPSLQQEIDKLNRFGLSITISKWDEYISTVKPKPVLKQMDMFA